MARQTNWDPIPWRRQPCDDDQSWAWFQVWLLSGACGGRRYELTQLAKRVSAREDKVWAACQACHWFWRGDQYDNHQTEQRFALVEQQNLTAAAVAAQAFEAAELLRQLGRPEVARLIRRAEATPDHPGTIPASLAVRATSLAEEVAQGGWALLPPTTRDDGPTGLENLTDEEVATLRRLTAKAQGQAA